MQRRGFMKLVAGAATWPLAAHAQQPGMRRVGALILGNADAEAFQKELREGLSKAGYFEGRNVQFDIRSAQGRMEQLPNLAAELVAFACSNRICSFRTFNAEELQATVKQMAKLKPSRAALN